MAKRRSKWDVLYHKIRTYKPPKSVKALIGLAWKIVQKLPHAKAIVMRAFEISKMAEGENIAGYLKKRKVVAGINRIAKEFDVEIPKKVAYFINEACALSAELIKKKKQPYRKEGVIFLCAKWFVGLPKSLKK